MPAMNTGLQRRIGRLPKTEDMLPSPKSLFGNSTHGGYMGRRPTPTSNGFFGLGSAHVSNEMGDGKLHIYGNDGVGMLPPPGIFGIGNVMNTYPTHHNTPGMYGLRDQAQSFVTNNMTLLAVVGVAGLLYYYRK
jgi:hypothetical protein